MKKAHSMSYFLASCSALALSALAIGPLGCCEIDKDARQIHAKNYGSEPEGRDATKLDAKDVPDHDILCAGFPCQAFSLAGKRLGCYCKPKACHGDVLVELVTKL